MDKSIQTVLPCMKSVVYGPAPVSVLLQPSVLFAIVDHYMRRKESQRRVIGTLVGSFVGDSVEVHDCYPIPHTETDDQVTVEVEYHRTMLALHQRVSPKDVIVGWYSTGNEVTDHSLLIHGFYCNEASSSIVHVTVDTTLSQREMSTKAYVSSPLRLGGQDVGKEFIGVPVKIDSFAAERTAIDTLKRHLEGPVRVTNEIEDVHTSIEAVLSNLAVIQEYVKNVLEGRVNADARIGRMLMDAVGAVPSLSSDDFDKVVATNLQDLLMVDFLSKLTRTQLALNDQIDRMPQ